jgi:plasmid stabilization system protein ParE
MVRKTLILLWMLFPVAVAAYHFNYGSKQVMRRQAYQRLCDIRRLEAQAEPDWPKIIEQYNALSEELPLDEDPIVLCEVRLAVCKCRLEMLDLETAIDELTRLLQETAAAYGENAHITRGVREQLGKAHYYATWVLKTNGAPETQWRPFAERARQLFRCLAELENPQEFQRYEDRIHQQFQKALEGGGRKAEGALGAGLPTPPRLDRTSRRHLETSGLGRGSVSRPAPAPWQPTPGNAEG